MFIVIEGLDGAGTTTQSSLLASSLTAAGHRVLETREPSDGPLGTLARQMLSGRVVGRPRPDGRRGAVDRETLALLFAADRRDHVECEITPALESGAWVVCDRYYHSSFAYQGDVDGSNHFDIAWVRGLNARARRPDVTFYLRVPVDECLRRISNRGQRDIYERRDKLERLAKRYEQVVEALAAEGERIEILDGTLDVAELAAQLAAAVGGVAE